MGDADISRRNIPALQIEQVTGVLDAIDDDLTFLHDTVTAMERRNVRALSIQMRGYMIFRRFFLAMNFILLPVLIIAGLCYSLKEMPVEEEFQPFLEGAIVILLYLTGGIGVPLYFGTLWAIYSFSANHIISDGDDLSSQYFDDYDKRSISTDVTQSEVDGEVEVASELEDDQFIVLSADQDLIPQMESKVKTETHAVERSSELSTSNGAEILQVEDDTEESGFTAGVDNESDTQGTDYLKQKDSDDDVIQASQIKWREEVNWK